MRSSRQGGGGMGRSKKIKNEINYIYGVHPSQLDKDVDRRYEVHLLNKGAFAFPNLDNSLN